MQAFTHTGEHGLAPAGHEERASARSWAVLAMCVGGCFAVGAVGGLFTAAGVSEWYPTLTRPSWTPPSAVFGPVWTVLYIAMGVAVWLVWERAGVAGARRALALFGAQLALNLAWSGLFFGLRSSAAGLVDIVTLAAAIVVTIAAFARHSRLAAALLVPYLAWVSFATALNAAIWWLNR